MNIIEYIQTERKKNPIRQSELPEVLGVSKQRFYQIMNNGDCSIAAARKMLRVLGKDLVLKKWDDTVDDINSDGVLNALEESDTSVKDAQTIMAAMGFCLDVKEVEDTSHESDLEE